MDKEQIIKSTLNILSAKVYPKIPKDFGELENDIHPKELIDVVYGNETGTIEELERIEKQWKLQDNYLHDGRNGNDVKAELSVKNLFASIRIVNGNRPKEVTDALFDISVIEFFEVGKNLDLAWIDCVVKAAKNKFKNKKNQIDFIREYLKGMEQYKEIINQKFIES